MGDKGGREKRSYTPGGTRQSNFCTTTFSRFRERNLRKGREARVEERRRIYMRASFQACAGGACLREKKEKEKKKTDELPLANRSLLRLFPLIGNYSISSVWKLIDALYET